MGIKVIKGLNVERERELRGLRHTEVGTRKEDLQKKAKNEYPRGRTKASRMWCPGSQVKRMCPKVQSAMSRAAENCGKVETGD